MLKTGKGFPYPEDTDPLSTYPQTIKSLAQEVDNQFRAGVDAVPTATAGTTATKTVTFAPAFPVGAEVAVSAVIVSTNPASGYVSVNNVTNTGFEIRAQRTINSGSTDVQWVAMRTSQ